MDTHDYYNLHTCAETKFTDLASSSVDGYLKNSPFSAILSNFAAL